VENDDGTVTSIYTHFDGYPEGHVPILTEHYAKPEKVAALMELGDLSMLAEELGEKHDFESRDEELRNQCLAYGRDRGEEDVASRTHEVDDWPDYGQEFEYLFRDGAWLMRPEGTSEWAPAVVLAEVEA